MQTVFGNMYVFVCACALDRPVFGRFTTNTFQDKVLCYPTTYLIGDNGIPIEIIAGAVSLDELLAKINNAVKVRNTIEANLTTNRKAIIVCLVVFVIVEVA
jgi:hypothetical protein